MKKVILNLASTLDGFIEGPNGEIDWCIMDDDMQFDTFLEDIDTVFYGRVSYDAWGNYQPDTNASASEKMMWRSLHSKNKFVFSHQNRTDADATFICSDIAENVAEIKKQGGKNIWLYGGASLIRTFVELDLIDLYKISLHPIALGRGKPLFENLKQGMGLTLTDCRVFRSGVVELTYEPDRNRHKKRNEPGTAGIPPPESPT